MGNDKAGAHTQDDDSLPVTLAPLSTSLALTQRIQLPHVTHNTLTRKVHVVRRDAVAPPQLSANAPITNVLEPSEPDRLKLL
jgi:hypothetical protein